MKKSKAWTFPVLVAGIACCGLVLAWRHGRTVRLLGWSLLILRPHVRISRVAGRVEWGWLLFPPGVEV